jgi:hypothetical protein
MVVTATRTIEDGEELFVDYKVDPASLGSEH